MKARELRFQKKENKWYFISMKPGNEMIAPMPYSTYTLLEYASQGKDEVVLKLLRKNTLEKVKIALGREKYMKGGALYYVLEYTGAQFGSKELKRTKIWIGSATRKVLNNFPEVINLTW